MRKRSVFAYVLFILLSILLISIGAISVISINTLSNFIYREAENSLEEQGQIILNFLPDTFIGENDTAQIFIDENFEFIDARITIISFDGYVLADSHNDKNKMENHSDRPEIADAINGKKGIYRRLSNTLSEHMLYIAFPPNNKNVVLRMALSVDHIRDKLFDTYKDTLLFSIIVLFITILVSIYTANSFRSTIKSIEDISTFYAKGDFTKKLKENGPLEVSQLKTSINSMGIQLQEIVKKATFQKNELQAMLNSMAESVILLNKKLLVKKMNPAAELLINKNLDYCRGKNITEIIDNEPICNLVRESLEKSEIRGETIRFNIGLAQFLQVHSSPLFDLDGNEKGILLVMNNITRTKQLENMRKDFVSNVSHELKTPVTLINGYVETLIDGASRDREKMDQFLNIINRHSKRISSIISDLLILSNIEDRGNNIIYEDLFLYDLLFSVYTSVLDNAEKGEISLKIDCDEQLKISANPILLEQAIFNLVSNALKYSGKGSQVIITGKMGSSTTNKQIHIHVKDDGIGIAKDQLDRIFERFYRVKRKHGEKMEGTGLGLSIVRHIILAHNGSIDVSSQEGKGCCFSIALPC